MRMFLVLFIALAASCASQPPVDKAPAPPSQPERSAKPVHLGPRPFFLVEQMAPGPLRDRLEACEGPFEPSPFSIGHRGAPMQFPEHTEESYRAAARMGAGVIECDVAFTADRELVCRHSQCDLHTTTDILQRPELAVKCTEPFSPADPATNTPASAKCCTSDITLQEFKSLCGKMDAADPTATNIQDYMKGTPDWRTDLYAVCGTVLSHKESVTLFQELGVQMTPELKAPMVPMPFEGQYSQQDYASQLIDELKAASVSPQDVFVQSFSLADVKHWLKHHPAYGKTAILLDGRTQEEGFDPENPATWTPSMTKLRQEGVRTLAPPLWMLVKNHQGTIQPSAYGLAAKDAGLDLIAWSLERSGQPSKTQGTNWYFQTLGDAIQTEGDVYLLLEVLYRDLNVRGVFSDWPATTTFFANCHNKDR